MDNPEPAQDRAPAPTLVAKEPKPRPAGLGPAVVAMGEFLTVKVLFVTPGSPGSGSLWRAFPCSHQPLLKRQYPLQAAPVDPAQPVVYQPQLAVGLLHLAPMENWDGSWLSLQASPRRGK